jgi:hypothetical protein
MTIKVDDLNKYIGRGKEQVSLEREISGDRV